MQSLTVATSAIITDRFTGDLGDEEAAELATVIDNLTASARGLRKLSGWF